LSGVVEAATWKHALEQGIPRPGKRIVVYPKELPHLREVLDTQNPDLDPENGCPIAYEKILEESQSFPNPPDFFREDSPEIVNSEELSSQVPVWMNIAANVSTGNRPQVSETGADVLNSDDSDSENDQGGDKEKNMYAPEMLDSEGNLLPGKSPKLTNAQAVVLRAASASQSKSANGTGESKVVPEECAAGGTRAVAGSWETGRRAAKRRPPKT
jgi:hypothetical protein